MTAEHVALTCFGKSYAIDILLSPQDFEWARSRGNWFITHGARTDGKRYAVRSENGRLLFLHKQILLRDMRLPESALHRIGDHINGNSLDNRRTNLRWATPQMNARNIFGFSALQMELSL